MKDTNIIRLGNRPRRKFRKPCKRCGEDFTPEGKYCKFCKPCRNKKYNK